MTIFLFSWFVCFDPVVSCGILKSHKDDMEFMYNSPDTSAHFMLFKKYLVDKRQWLQESQCIYIYVKKHPRVSFEANYCFQQIYQYQVKDTDQFT